MGDPAALLAPQFLETSNQSLGGIGRMAEELLASDGGHSGQATGGNNSVESAGGAYYGQQQVYHQHPIPKSKSLVAGTGATRRRPSISNSRK